MAILVVIVTWPHSTGGLPHQRARWFAMTGNLEPARQTPICRHAVKSDGRILFPKNIPGISARDVGGVMPLRAAFRHAVQAGQGEGGHGQVDEGEDHVPLLGVSGHS